MKTIGYVLPTFPVLSETFIGNEMRAMLARGHRVIPLVLQRATGPGQPADEDLRPELIHLDDIPWRRCLTLRASPTGLRKALAFTFCQRGLSRVSLLATATRIAAVAQAAGCRHLHAHFAQASAATAIVAARLAGLTVSFVGHGFDVYAAPVDLSLKLDAADLAVAVCRDMAGDFAALCPSARIAMIACGVDPQRFVPAPPGAHDDRLRLLFVGRLVDSKGLDDVLAAMALLPGRPVHLDVIGDGPMREAWIELARRIGIAERVRFLGSHSSEDLRRLGPYYDALVAPFRVGVNGTRDTGPVVAKEAMAMGVPVIATRFMGLKEIVGEGCGYLVPPGDVPGLAAAIARLGDLSPGERRNMGMVGRARVFRLFTLERQAERLSLAIERACSQGSLSIGVQK